MSEVATDRSAMSTVTASYLCHIQPATDTKRALADGVFGKRFRIYVDSTSAILEGDRVIDSDGNNYTVVSDGVSRREFGSIDFKLIIVEKTK